VAEVARAFEQDWTSGTQSVKQGVGIYAERKENIRNPSRILNSNAEGDGMNTRIKAVNN